MFITKEMIERFNNKKIEITHEILMLEDIDNIDISIGKIIQIDNNSLILDYGKGLTIINLKDIMDIKEKNENQWNFE